MFLAVALFVNYMNILLIIIHIFPYIIAISMVLPLSNKIVYLVVVM